jgi:hypothetical protein
MAEYRLIRDVAFRSRSGNEYVGEGVHDVDEEDVDHVEEHDAWLPVEQDADDADSDADGGEASDTSSEPADEETASEGADGVSDAEAFVNRHHATVRNAIEDGEADGSLEAVLEAEEERDGGARGSVVSTIEARRDEVGG